MTYIPAKLASKACFADLGDTGLLGGRRYLLISFNFENRLFLRVGIKAASIISFRFSELDRNCRARPAYKVTELARLHADGLPISQSVIPLPALPYLCWVDPL